MAESTKEKVSGGISLPRWLLLMLSVTLWPLLYGFFQGFYPGCFHDMLCGLAGPNTILHGGIGRGFSWLFVEQPLSSGFGGFM